MFIPIIDWWIRPRRNDEKIEIDRNLSMWIWASSRSGNENKKARRLADYNRERGLDGDYHLLVSRKNC